MTHPDTLQIPRAVVEQALEALENAYSGSIQGYHETFDNLHAALQPQAAAEPVEAAKKDAVFQASIDFIRELTGMEPPPIEVAPPDTFKPFKTFTDKVCSIFATPPTTQAEAEQHTFNDESPFCVKCGSTGEDAEGPVAHILPRDLKILKFKSMPVPVDPLPYDNGEEKTVPLYTSPPATQAAPVSLQPAHDAVTIDTLNDRVMRQQAALTAALGALKNSVDTVWEEYTEAERKYAAYDSRRAKLDGMKAMAQAHTDAIAQIEALGE